MPELCTACPTHYHARPHPEIVARNMPIATQAQVAAGSAVYRAAQRLGVITRSFADLVTTHERFATAHCDAVTAH